MTPGDTAAPIKGNVRKWMFHFIVIAFGMTERDVILNEVKNPEIIVL
jgi:hypothetical protein